MALAHRVVAIYPTGTADPNGTASQYGGNYSASYTTMSAMEAAENGDLDTGDGTILHVEIIPSDGSWNAAPDTTTPVIFDGWATDRGGDGSYVEIKTYGTARSSNGLFDTAAYILKNSAADRNLRIDNDHDNTEYLDIEFVGVQFEQTQAQVNIYLHGSQYLKDIRFLKCYCKQGAASHNFFSVLSDNVNLVIRLKNSIFEGGLSGVYTDDEMKVLYLYNCTVFDCAADAVESNGYDFRPVNCAVFNNVDDWQDTFPAGYPNYCASDDNDIGDNKVDISPPGETELVRWHEAFTDPDGSPPDVTIKDADSVLYHAGQNQTADSEVPSDDIIGTTRPAGASAVSIGAFEIAAAGPTAKAVSGSLAMSATLSRKLSAKRSVAGAI